MSSEDLDALADQLGLVHEVFANGRKTIKIQEAGRLHGDLASAYARACWHARAADYQPPAKGPRPRGVSEYAGEMGSLRDV